MLVTYREDLPLNEANQDIYSLDFAIYDDAIITDRGRKKGLYFGKRTQKAQEIAKYQRLFDLIQHHSHKFLSPQETEQYLVSLADK